MVLAILCILSALNSIINPIGIYDELVFKWIKTFDLALKSRIEGAWSYVKGLFDHEEVVNHVVQTLHMVEMQPEQVTNQNKQIKEIVEMQPKDLVNENVQIKEMVEMQPEDVVSQM